MLHSFSFLHPFRPQVKTSSPAYEMDNNTPKASHSKASSSLAFLDSQMKELLAAFQKQAVPNYKDMSFYDDAVTIKRLRVKLHSEEEDDWKLYLMMPNGFKCKFGGSKSFSPSIVVLPASDVKELLSILQGLALEVLTNGKTQQLPRISNHVNGSETNPKKEEFWDRDFTSSLASGNLLIRPWRYGSTPFIKMLSPRPPSDDYEWLGVQLTLYMEEAVQLCCHLQEFLQELQGKGITF